MVHLLVELGSPESAISGMPFAQVRRRMNDPAYLDRIGADIAHRAPRAAALLAVMFVAAYGLSWIADPARAGLYAGALAAQVLTCAVGGFAVRRLRSRPVALLNVTAGVVSALLAEIGVVVALTAGGQLEMLVLSIVFLVAGSMVLFPWGGTASARRRAGGARGLRRVRCPRRRSPLARGAPGDAARGDAGPHGLRGRVRFTFSADAPSPRGPAACRSRASPTRADFGGRAGSDLGRACPRRTRADRGAR